STPLKLTAALCLLASLLAGGAGLFAFQGRPKAEARPDREGAYSEALNVNVPSVATDRSVVWDYPIVYVRAPRKGDQGMTRWADVFDPVRMEPGSDLVLLRPDLTEEVLVAGGEGAVADPFVSFDGEWVYYAHVRLKNPRGLPGPDGADIYKIHVKSR